MLDDNLPTFRFRPSSDSPLSNVLYFTKNGSDPAAEYVFRRADPALPASRNRYAAAMCDAINPDVIYGEVLIEPEWSQPTLSSTEIRAQAQNGGPPAPATAGAPDTFAVHLYNPDQSVSVKMVPGGWNKSDSWEFDMPVQTFRQPSASELDRQQGAPADLVPRILFRWKKDGRLSKDMTCYMSGTSLGGRKNKEPDITIAMFKAARDSAVTVYEPNLHRVEIEDRKGLELVILLSAEVIKELYITPKMDIFNVQGGAPPVAVNGGRRKNSRPSPPPAAAMPGAIPQSLPPGAGSAAPAKPKPTVHFAANTAPAALAGPAGAAARRPSAEIEAETRRLQAMVEREEREREKRERAEQKRIKKMLEEEDRERRRREAEVAKETERLRKQYGVEGQDLPSASPPLPPRNPAVIASANHAHSSNASSAGIPQFAPPPTAPVVVAPPPHFFKQGLTPWGGGAPSLPPRPVSAGPGPGPFHCSTLNALWNGPGGSGPGPGWGVPQPPPHLQQQQQQQQQPDRRRRRGSGGAPYMENESRSRVGRGDDDRRRVQKKRSSVW